MKCPNIEATEGLKASSLEAVGLSAEVTFECTNGNSLIGAPKVKCLPSGIWDHPIPACQDIVCPENITLWATSLRPHLKVQVHSFGAGGHAFFSCQRGHTLVGTKKAKCLRNGEWSVALLDINYQKDQLPQCHPIICSEYVSFFDTKYLQIQYTTTLLHFFRLWICYHMQFDNMIAICQQTTCS